MISRTLQLLAALGLLALGGCGGGDSSGGASKPAASPTYAVSGTVLDRAGLPVAGVTISAFHHNDNTTVTTLTDANGAFAFSGLANSSNADYALYAEKAGLAFVPAASYAVAALTRFDFNGQYRGVIRIPTLPPRDVAGNNFTALRAGDRQLSLPRTGQQLSYASGDDFEAQQGVRWPAIRFTDNANGTVTDQLTGLVWLRNAGCFSARDWSAAIAAAAQLASGACGLSDGSAAGQWRMPNINELESLIDIGRVNPAIAASHPFTNVDLANAYWSSTTYTALPANAMAIRFADGRWINGIDAGDGGVSNAKTTALNSVWAVRSGAAGVVQLAATGVYLGVGGGSFAAGDDALLQRGVAAASPRFIDKGDGTLVDSLTGLTWLKQADCIHQSWNAALAQVGSLANGQCGLSDGSVAGQWRMPNRSEMLSLSDRAPTFPQASYFNGQAQANSNVTGPVIFNRFIVSDYYWTSSTNANDTTQAWAVYSCDFGAYNLAKTELRYALAVR